MITRRDLIRALQKEKRVADWVVIERAQELAVADDQRSVIRREQRTRLALVIHTDTSLGRGSAQLAIDATEGSSSAIVTQGLALAAAAIGPAWKSVPPAAPADVIVMEPELVTANLIDVARELIARAKGPGVKARASVLRERILVQAHSGFHESWSAMELRADALVIAGNRSIEITREARRRGDLGLKLAIDEANADLAKLEHAGAPPTLTEKVDLVLETDALLHGDGLGVWSVFAIQADSTLERQGLTRYRPGAPIAPGAAQAAEPLTITSDGARDFGLRSAPVGEEGDAIRKFLLVERGVSSGLALSMREAALRGRDPNGGVRNLVIAPGLWNGTLARRAIRVRRLRALSIDRFNGDANLEIAVALDEDGGSSRPFSGGTIRLDLIAGLARARRRQIEKPLERGAYVGPPSVLIEGVELVS